MDASQKFVKIRINSIHPAEPVPFDLYVTINNRQVHYLRAGDILSREKLSTFEKKAPDSFYIRAEDRGGYKKYIHDQISSTRLSSAEKAIILKESTFSLVEEMYESPDIGRVLAEMRAVVDDFINFMENESDAMANLIGLSSHDFYTYNHSLDVCIYSLGLGQIAGFKGKELHELGQGGLFHDIGKRFVSLDIITKKGPLDDHEWAQMRKHPQFGLKVLMDHNAPENVKACCLEHHESRIGNGYPQQLKGEEIHPMARIVAIADTYDALTTKRSYNDPMTPTDALNFMKEKLSGRFDEELLKAMYFTLFKMKEKIAG